jgi:hypothetical protein
MMDIRTASRWFAAVWLDGLIGGEWVERVGRVTLTPHDQFVSDQEFGHKIRGALAAPGDTRLLQSAAVRISDEPDQIYLLRAPNFDRRGEIYQVVLALHVAKFTAVITRTDRMKLASGVEGAAFQTEVARVPCDVQPVTFVTSDTSSAVRYGDAICVLPRGAPIDSTLTIEIPEQFSTMEVRHVYEAHGNLYARGVLQRQPTAERMTA